jgi:Carboxypeptidase regulatory-like domain/TonB-dependent Receptor Plug Domain
MFSNWAGGRARSRSHRLAVATVAMFPGVVAAQARGTLVGVVRDTAGSPVAEADVSIAALRLLTRTDDSGAFTLRRVQPGRATLMVRRLGFNPTTMELEVRSGAVESLRVELQALPVQLAGVTVSERELRRRAAIEEFYRRRARGIGGAFVTRHDIESQHASRLSDVLRNVPSLRFVRIRGGMGVRFVTASTQRRDCAPMIWLDGVRAPGMEIDDLPPNTIEGVELYHGPSTTPMQFSQGGVTTCGTIVIWSRVPGT